MSCCDSESTINYVYSACSKAPINLFSAVLDRLATALVQNALFSYKRELNKYEDLLRDALFNSPEGMKGNLKTEINRCEDERKLISPLIRAHNLNYEAIPEKFHSYISSYITDQVDKLMSGG